MYASLLIFSLGLTSIPALADVDENYEAMSINENMPTNDIKPLFREIEKIHILEVFFQSPENFIILMGPM